MQIDIYADGSCSPNPGEGGWGVVLLAHINGRQYTRTVSGYCPASTTNNRMELESIAQGLRSM